MKKVLLIGILVSLVVLAGCSKENKNNSNENYKDNILTIEELAEFDGKNGEKAYVAVDGIVYDVTDLSAWTDGKHNGVLAGNDLTQEIKEKSPHGTSKLSSLPKVGVLKEDSDE